MKYFGFSFPQAFLLGDPEWFKRLDMQRAPDEFDPFEHGLHDIFSILHGVLNENGAEKDLGGCYMFGQDFPPLLKGMDMAGAFRDAREHFEINRGIAFEPIIHISTQKGHLPLEGNYFGVLQDGLESCATINATSLVIHPPEVRHDVTAQLVDLFCSSACVDLLSKTNVTLYIENGLNGEFFGSLQDILAFHSMLSDRCGELGFKPVLSRMKFCLDTGHLLLWRYHHGGGLRRADAEIEAFLPELARNTGVLHVKACDSGKEYITPFARKEPLFLDHSQKVVDWLDLIKNVRSSSPRYYCMEIPKRNFIIKEISGFKKYIA